MRLSDCAGKSLGWAAVMPAAQATAFAGSVTSRQRRGAGMIDLKRFRLEAAACICACHAAAGVLDTR
jgi:hypothetical protein